MEFRHLGRSGLKVSAVGVGCNNFGGAADAAMTKAIVHKALDLGVVFFDTADIYGNGLSEEFLCKALGARRTDVIVATKFGMTRGADSLATRGGGSRDYIMRAVEASLKRLGTDYIDLYQIHTPDRTTPIAETLATLDTLVRQGKVRYIGHSNFAGWQAADAACLAETKNLTPFISAQNRYSLLTRDIEAELVPACEAHGVGILPYFPLESGLLTGKYKRGAKPAEGTRYATWTAHAPGYVDAFFGDAQFAKVEKLEAVAKSGGCAMLDLAIGWLLSRAAVASVIAGATKPEQVEANVRAAGWRPNAEEVKRIDDITGPPKPLFG